jgi:hypothetical protein
MVFQRVRQPDGVLADFPAVPGDLSQPLSLRMDAGEGVTFLVSAMQAGAKVTPRVAATEDRPVVSCFTALRVDDGRTAGVADAADADAACSQRVLVGDDSSTSFFDPTSQLSLTHAASLSVEELECQAGYLMQGVGANAEVERVRPDPSEGADLVSSLSKLPFDLSAHPDAQDASTCVVTRCVSSTAQTRAPVLCSSFLASCYACFHSLRHATPDSLCRVAVRSGALLPLPAGGRRRPRGGDAVQQQRRRGAALPAVARSA